MSDVARPYLIVGAGVLVVAVVHWANRRRRM